MSLENRLEQLLMMLVMGLCLTLVGLFLTQPAMLLAILRIVDAVISPPPNVNPPESLPFHNAPYPTDLPEVQRQRTTVLVSEVNSTCPLEIMNQTTIISGTMDLHATTDIRGGTMVTLGGR